MSGTTNGLGYTPYQARTTWYMQSFQVGPTALHKSVMEDGSTELGVMEFGPQESKRRFWTYATNGMSERRMPCVQEPHGDPKFRLELLGYCENRADWVVKLLEAMACYPFQHGLGFAIGHTIPVSAPRPRLWDGYLLVQPLMERGEFNPMAIDVGIGDDWIFFAQVLGLVGKELDFGISKGGPALEKRIRAACSEDELATTCFLDRKRKPLI
jgi:hypothetical protein